MYAIIKKNKRLHVERDGEMIYTPPDFVKLNNRAALQMLADNFNELQRRDITIISEFEYKNSKRGRLA